MLLFMRAVTLVYHHKSFILLNVMHSSLCYKKTSFSCLIVWFIANSLSLYWSVFERTVATVFLQRFCTQAHLETNVPLIEKSFPPHCLNTGVDSGENDCCCCCCCRIRSFKYDRNAASAEYTGRTCGHSSNYQTIWVLHPPATPPSLPHKHTYTPFLVFPPSKLKQCSKGP